MFQYHQLQKDTESEGPKGQPQSRKHQQFEGGKVTINGKEVPVESMKQLNQHLTMAQLRRKYQEKEHTQSMKTVK